jgi:hypothetical protein
MADRMHRIVTDHNDQGKTVFINDSEPPRRISLVAVDVSTLHPVRPLRSQRLRKLCPLSSQYFDGDDSRLRKAA